MLKYVEIDRRGVFNVEGVDRLIYRYVLFGAGALADVGSTFPLSYINSFILYSVDGVVSVEQMGQLLPISKF